MRPLYVPVRLAVTVLAVTATAAGCVNVGDDAGRARPSHSAGQHGGEAPDGGPVNGLDGRQRGKSAGDGKHGNGGKAAPGVSPGASATSSDGAGGASVSPSQPGKPAKAGKPGKTTGPGGPGPTQAPPTPPVTSAPPPPPASTPPAATSEPPSAEPSSSAHQGTGPQLVQREPAPRAGVPA